MRLQTFGAFVALGLAAWPWRVGAADLPGDLVFLRSVAPEIVQDIRYAGSDNFTGAKVPGYEAGECILRKGAADALKAANDALRARGLALRVFDCYRPERAVAAFMRWANARKDERSNRYHPQIARGALVAQGYVAPKSGHSSGFAVDLTIAAMTNEPKPDEPTRRDNCATTVEGSHPQGLDMGTEFDCFDPKSHTSAAGLTSTQRQNRQLLLDVMNRHGFSNYYREWWHFTHRASVAGAKAHDFPITPTNP
ncbi:MAG: M15 family metallopeptidase [Hyphomicrobiaceae bacterium]